MSAFLRSGCIPGDSRWTPQTLAVPHNIIIGVQVCFHAIGLAPFLHHPLLKGCRCSDVLQALRSVLLLQDFVQSAHARAGEASDQGNLSTRAQVLSFTLHCAFICLLWRREVMLNLVQSAHLWVQSHLITASSTPGLRRSYPRNLQTMDVSPCALCLNSSACMKA